MDKPKIWFLESTEKTGQKLKRLIKETENETEVAIPADPADTKNRQGGPVRFGDVTNHHALGG